MSDAGCRRRDGSEVTAALAVPLSRTRGPSRPRRRTLAPTPTRTRREGDVAPHGGRYLAGLHGTLRSEEGVHVKYSRRAATTGGGAGESDESRTLRDGIQAALRISVGKYCPLASADCRDKRTDGFIK